PEPRQSGNGAPGSDVHSKLRPAAAASRQKVTNVAPSQSVPKNRLLQALPARDLGQILPRLDQIECQRDHVLLDADSSLDQIFFPEIGVISVVAVYADGSSIEMATIGREGCTGFQALFGARRSSARFLVQVPGTALKMPARAFRHALETMPPFREL